MIEGFVLLEDIRTQVPDVEDVVAVTGIGGTDLPAGVSYNPETGILRSEAFIPDLMIEVTVHEKGKVRKLTVQITKK